MKIKMVLLLAIIFMSLQTVAQHKGIIAGTVVDEKSDPVIGAIIEVMKSGVKVAGMASDYDGAFTISLPEDKYEIIATYAGYSRQRIKDVKVKGFDTTRIVITFKPSTLQEVEIKYVTPLIRDGAVRNSISYEDIRHMPTINTTRVVPSSGPRLRSDGRNQGINAGGQRSGGTVTYIDGIMVSGSVPNLPQGNIQQISATQYFNPSNEEYKKVEENDFMNVKASPLSTMSIDVDRAAYSNVRRHLQSGMVPPADAVRIEEMINYFSYHYAPPEKDEPIAIHSELTNCPWEKEHKLLKIGMQAKTISYEKLPPSNLVFLIDVSGSMSDQDKLPLLISSMQLLVNNLRNEDRVSIVVYAGNAGLVLPVTSGKEKDKINRALAGLQSGGSTAGGEGILLAYKTAQENFIKGGNNRVILATDGDFNVGVSADNELEELITKEREKGVFLSCLGFGTGNFKDAKMEMLADKGNGNYSYIDNLDEGRKTLVNEFGGTLFTIAKDVKAQIEFNPAKVQSYRLVGYESRMLKTEDFKDDKKDAGELGSGHTVTFIYEIVPTGVKDPHNRKVNELKYQETNPVDDDLSNEFATIKFRYKKPDGDKSREMSHVILDQTKDITEASEDTRFAYSVALFGMVLKNSKYKGTGTLQDALRMAKESIGEDTDGYRAELIDLIKKARDLPLSAAQ